MPDIMDSLGSTALLLLAGAALLWIGSAVIGRMRREATTPLADRADADPLAPFEDAYRRGQMSDEEYQRIRQNLRAGGGLMAAPGRPNPPPRPSAPPPAPPADPAPQVPASPPEADPAP